MRRRPRPEALLLVVAALATAPGRAVDPPHWSGQVPLTNCTLQCHTLHAAPGVQLTAAAGNVNLCQSCHNPIGDAAGLPLANVDRAVPGVGGTSHAFDVLATNPASGALPPEHPQMLARVMDGQIVCSTCHDQHAAESADGGTPRISPATKVTAGASPLLATGGTYTGSGGLWYLVEVTTGGSVAATRFRWSKDNGISWAGTNVAASESGVALDNGVLVAFPAGTYAAGERYELSASWPFLRAALDSGDNASGPRFCRDCHRPWTMDHLSVRTWDGTAKSHPVGVGLDAPGASAANRSVPLDGNGWPQGSGLADGNPTNDLGLDGTGNVQCLTCHAVHYADSNTLTEDGPGS